MNEVNDFKLTNDDYIKITRLFTIKIKGVKYVPTIEDRNKHLFKLTYNDIGKTYQIIKEEYTKDSWKIIREGIKEDLYRQIKRKRIELKRKELFGVWVY